jgi:hypothetical protein
MDQKIKFNIPQHSVTYLAICLFGMLVFILVGVVPSQRSIAGLDRKISDVTFQIEEQRTLAPFNQALSRQLVKKDSDALPFPPRVKLAQGQVDKIAGTFRDVGSQSNMEVLSVSPDLKYFANESKMLPVNMVTRGNFQNLRKLLIGLLGIPYVEQIEEIQIQQGADKLEFRVKVWVGLA